MDRHTACGQFRKLSREFESLRSRLSQNRLIPILAGRVRKVKKGMPSKILNFCLLIICLTVGLDVQAEEAGHRVLLHGNNRLAIIEADGEISWEMRLGGIHDIHVLPNGHFLVQQRNREIVDIDPITKKLTSVVDVSKSSRNEGVNVEVHAFQPIAEGGLMIAESGPGRLIELDREGQVKKSIPLKRRKPHPHHDTRLVRRTPVGTYLVAHENDGAIREYDGVTGKVVWEYEIPLFGNERKGGHGPEAFGNQTFAAVRLGNGNTLIATGNGHSVIEVTPEKKVVWRLSQNDLPGIRLAWVTTLEVLENGNYVIGNCHAGSGQPLLVEVVPSTKKVVWQLDRYEDFGNNVSNSILLDQVGKAVR